MKRLLDTLDQNSSNKILEALGDIFPGIIAITDENVKVLWANKAFVELTGYTFDEMVGKKPGEILQGPQTDKDTIIYMAESIKKKQPFSADVLNYRKDGSTYWVRLFSQPVFVDDSLKFWVATKYDVTHEKLLEKQITFEQEVITAGTSRINRLLSLYEF